MRKEGRGVRKVEGRGCKWSGSILEEFGMVGRVGQKTLSVGHVGMPTIGSE